MDFLSTSGKTEKNFFATLNVMISQMVRNYSIWFGRHIDLEVGYKILRLQVQNEVLILYNAPCFQ
jgi:hypothetical protein